MTSSSALGTAPSGWPGTPAAASPGASAGAAPRTAGSSRTSCSSRCPTGRGYRLDLASTELLRLGLQLDRDLDRCARYRPRQVREQLRLPKLWAGFRPADAATHHRRRAGTGGLRARVPAGRPGACWNICAAITSAWRSIRLPGSATTGSRPWRSSPTWSDFPSGRSFRLRQPARRSCRLPGRGRVRLLQQPLPHVRQAASVAASRQPVLATG